MKKILASLVVLVLVASCKKGETNTPQKTYTVQYKLELAAVANTTLTGTATYISKTSATSTATLASPGWTVTESNWALKTGDRIGFTTNITNLASYKAFLIIDGGVKVLQSEASSFPLNGKIDVYYTMP
jgi:hypothetical protein